MTKYEQLIGSGPSALAAYIAERKIYAVKSAARRRDGIDMVVSAETYEKTVISEFRRLMEEVE